MEVACSRLEETEVEMEEALGAEKIAARGRVAALAVVQVVEGLPELKKTSAGG